MAVNDDLFQLIRSLTPSEKRYFKIHAKTHVGDKYKNSYEKLFDALNYWAEEDYDELLFKRKHKGKSFLKNLSAEKNYLYELILTTMRSFHNKKTIEQQINDLLLDEDFFRRKRLNEARKKAIDKAKVLAGKYEKLPALLQISEREINMQKEWQQDELKELALKDNTTENELIAQLSLLSNLRHLSNRLFIQVRINTNQSSPALQAESLRILNEPVVTNHQTGHSFWCDYHYYRIYAMHYRIHKKMSDHRRYTGLIFDLYEKQFPHQKQYHTSGYKIALYNYLNSCFTAGDLSDFPLLLEKARSLPSLSKDEEGEDWQNLMHLELIYLLNTGHLKQAMNLSNPICKGIIRYKSKINKAREMALYYNLATAFFLWGDWANAITYYNNLLHEKTEVRIDLKLIAELLLIASQLELGNTDLSDYLLRNIQRRFKRTDRQEAIKAFHYFTQKLIAKKPITKSDLEVLISQFKAHIELVHWIHSKTEKKNITQLFLEQLASAPEPR